MSSLVLLSTPTCTYCPRVKDIIEKNNLTNKVKFLNATEPDNRKLCIDNNVRTVPTLLNTDTKQSWAVGEMSEEDILNLINS